MERIAKPLKPALQAGLQGISARQLGEHHDVLYAGYIKKIGEIGAKLAAADRSDANATYSIYGELKREEAFCTNAVTLHELYFDSLGGDGKPSGKLAELIARDFGSAEKWEEDFKAAGMAARGWVALAFDSADGKLHNYSLDIHTQGIWGAEPLLVLDVYEHAYFTDYGTARKKYIDAFMRNADWAAANARAQKLATP
jgi:Fe-Mn family superoxide dismutase